MLLFLYCICELFVVYLLCAVRGRKKYVLEAFIVFAICDTPPAFELVPQLTMHQ